MRIGPRLENIIVGTGGLIVCVLVLAATVRHLIAYFGL